MFKKKRKMPTGWPFAKWPRSDHSITSGLQGGSWVSCKETRSFTESKTPTMHRHWLYNAIKQQCKSLSLVLESGRKQYLPVRRVVWSRGWSPQECSQRRGPGLRTQQKLSWEAL